jgi:hypothetical protein
VSYDPTRSKWAPLVRTYGDEKPRGDRIIIYGEYGAGKTTLAATWPSPFFLDIDKGETNETRDRHLRYITFGVNGIYDNLFKVLEDFLYHRDVFDPDGGPDADCQTIVLDSWTKINEYILADVCKKGIGAGRNQGSIDVASDRPAISQYGFLLSRQQSISSILREISDSGRHTIITALPMVEGSEEERKSGKAGELKTVFEEVIGIPNMVGKYKYQIGAEFDELYYLRQADVGSTRYLHTQRYGIWRAKTRRKLPAVITNPSYDVIEKLKEGARKP